MGNITKSRTMRLIKFQNLRRATMLLIKFQNLRRATMLLINVQNSWELPCPYKNSRVLEATTPLHHQLHHVAELHHNIKQNKTYPATMIIGGTTATSQKHRNNVKTPNNFKRQHVRNNNTSSSTNSKNLLRDNVTPSNPDVS